MWGEFCEVYSPDAERKKELEELDLKTLELLYAQLDKRLNFLKDEEPKSKSIMGMELAIQTIFNIIADKNVISS